MTKTPEQLAEEYADESPWHLNQGEWDEWTTACKGFLAGYQAAKDQLADTGKVMPQWISVKERLPEEGQIVLTSCEQGKMFLLRKVSEEFLGSTLLWKYCCGYDKDLVDGESYCYEITHWMPLPEAPKEEK